MTRHGLPAVPPAIPEPREPKPFVPAIARIGVSRKTSGSLRPATTRIRLISGPRAIGKPQRAGHYRVAKLHLNLKSP